MSETLNILAQLGMLIFVLATMLGTGLSLTVPQILAPLRDWVLILKALLVNFIFVPLVAYLLVIVFDLD
ncbi:MAG TPA: bile acid:sodium symporter family protein, partial [Methylothermaceae bacterium]|nr:bile acid:sodium symporter family protein [Methylothermaceae bacterium]